MIYLDPKKYISDKVMPIEKLIPVINNLKKEGKKIGLCLGCFNLLHPGHINYLNSAKKMCDVLVVGIATDELVESLKPHQLIYPQEIRAFMIGEIRCVDFVSFNENVGERDMIRLIKPNIYIKGIDYSSKKDKGILYHEKLLSSWGGVIKFTNTEKLSSTKIIDHIKTTKNMDKLNFILTSDDVGRDSVENFNKFISLLEEFEIKCTFFAVPKPRDNIPLNENKDWILALKNAVKLGHDVQLHGFTHERFECGFPDNLVWSLYPENERENLKKNVIENKKEIEQNLEFDKLMERLSQSKKIFEEVMGYSPVCFRSPLLGTHENLYKALAKLGIKHSSNIVVNPDGWNYIKKKTTEKEWNKKRILPVPTKMREGIIELPISCEYSWFLKEEDFDRALELMKYDARRISKINNSFMMPLSHFYAVVKSPVGIELYRGFFDWAKKNFDFKSYTIKEYIKENII